MSKTIILLLLCLFTPEQHKLYQIRYTEGFDLPDPDYQAWLDIYHPKTPSSSAVDSIVTVLILCLLVRNHLMLTARTRRKRKPGLNSKATALTDDAMLAAMEVEKYPERKLQEFSR